MTPALACACLCEDSGETHLGKAMFPQEEGAASRQGKMWGTFQLEEWGGG